MRAWEKSNNRFPEIGLQSTPPMRVATTFGILVRSSRIYFNPRHPYGWRRRNAFVGFAIKIISIHATHTGGDLLFLGDFLIFLISIHATHTGGDLLCRLGVVHFPNFNPRHPYGWRLKRLLWPSPLIRFQSTPPIRVATIALFRIL